MELSARFHNSLPVMMKHEPPGQSITGEASKVLGKVSANERQEWEEFRN